MGSLVTLAYFGPEEIEQGVGLHLLQERRLASLPRAEEQDGFLPGQRRAQASLHMSGNKTHRLHFRRIWSAVNTSPIASFRCSAVPLGERAVAHPVGEHDGGQLALFGVFGRHGRV